MLFLQIDYLKFILIRLEEKIPTNIRTFNSFYFLIHFTYLFQFGQIFDKINIHSILLIILWLIFPDTIINRIVIIFQH